jgi:hypothetical protein
MTRRNAEKILEKVRDDIGAFVFTAARDWRRSYSITLSMADLVDKVKDRENGND